MIRLYAYYRVSVCSIPLGSVVCALLISLAPAQSNAALANHVHTITAKGSADRAGGGGASSSVAAAFEQTLAKHLRALENRDLEAYASTLNRDTTLLLPDGTLYRGKRAVIAFHRKFLADRGWTQDFEKIRQIIHPHVGLAFFRVVYRAHDENGKVTYESHFLMSLTFVRENGNWQLINDQVTKPPAAA